jgi:lipoyl(octanoyl) transferase
MNCDIIRPGLLEYQEGLKLQNDLVTRRQRNEITDTLILLEHTPVVTMGRRADESHLTTTPGFLKSKGIAIHPTDRGGEATYHGPGQIVGYLILDITKRAGFVKKFVWDIEEIFIRLLKNEYGIESNRDLCHRGVWIMDEKITAVGISVKKGITMHGFAFNVCNDLAPFSWILPCGIPDKGVTSLEKTLGRKVEISKVYAEVEKYFKEVFGYT